MNRPLSFALCTAALMVTSTGALAGEDAKVAAEVIAITRAQWAAEAQGKSVAEQNAALADDYTEFNGDYPIRLDGKALNSALSEALARSGDRAILGDMQNAKVQVYGDVAILTYNYVGVDLHKDGKTASSVAKSTRVYVRTDGQWKLVHANFAPVVPPED
jgi:ketosteroid isomerase-like protein